MFGTAAIYRTENSGNIRYELDTGTGHFGMFGGTTSILLLYPQYLGKGTPGVFTLSKWLDMASTYPTEHSDTEHYNQDLI